MPPTPTTTPTATATSTPVPPTPTPTTINTDRHADEHSLPPTPTHTPRTPTATPKPSGLLLKLVTPNQSYNDSPSDSEIVGADFQSGISVTVGSQALENIEWVNSTAGARRPAGRPRAGCLHRHGAQPWRRHRAVLQDAYTVLDVTSDDFFAGDEDLWSDPLDDSPRHDRAVGVECTPPGGGPAPGHRRLYYVRADGTQQECAACMAPIPVPISPGQETVEALMVPWDTTGLTGTVPVVGEIDPDQWVTEAATAQ